MSVEVIGPSVEQMGRTIGEWVKAATIDAAETALREEVAKGFDNEPVVITDGMPRRDYQQVKPFGKIEFAARANMLEVIMWANARLYALSPVGLPPDPHPGHYRRSHLLMVNGQEVTGNWALALRELKPGDRVQLVNPLPYARKLEGATASRRTGRKKRRPSSRQAPQGIYRVLVAELIQRYGRSMFFDYKLVPLNLGVKVWGAVGGGRRKVKGKWVDRQPRGRARRAQVYPAVQFFIQPVRGTFDF